jgi:polar amino acid transport system substrate-binding protein
LRALSLILALSLASAAALARPLEAVQKSGALRVAVYLDYKPFSYSDNGQPKGVDVEIAQALADALKLRLDLFELRADDDLNDDLRNGVWKGTVFGAAPGDVMMHVPFDARIAKENDRVALYAPYHVDGVAMFVDPAQAVAASDLSLLKTQKVAVAVGTIGDYVLSSTEDHAYLNQVVHERTLSGAAGRFERGDVAAFFGEQSAGESFARTGKRPYAVVHPAGNFAQTWTLGVAVKSDSRDLGAAVAEAMEVFAREGRLARIYASHGVDWREPEAAH